MTWRSLTRVVAPQVSVLDVVAAKAHIKVEGDEEDADIKSLVSEATAHIDGPNGIGIAMVEQTWRLSLDGFPRELLLPLGPVREVVSLSYVDGAGDSQTIPSTQYLLDTDQQPASLIPTPGSSWPAPRRQPGSVKIVFKAGYGQPADVPADLIAAVKLIVGALYKDRESAIVPAGAQAILNRYRAGFVV